MAGWRLISGSMPTARRVIRSRSTAGPCCGSRGWAWCARTPISPRACGSCASRRSEPVEDRYEILTAKRRVNNYRANRKVFHLETAAGAKLDVVFQVSNDGVAFRYLFPGDECGAAPAHAKSSRRFISCRTRRRGCSRCRSPRAAGNK